MTSAACVRIVVLILGLVCAAGNRSLAAQSEASADVKALTAAAEHFLDVFQNLDWEKFRAVWTSEPTVFFPFNETPERVTGAQAVEARWQEFFNSRRTADRKPPYFKVTPQQLLAQVHGDAGIVTFNLGQPPGPMGRRTLVFVKEKGEWKLAHLHASTAGQR